MKICVVCNIEFNKPKSASATVWAKRKYCSTKCMGVGQKGIKRSPEIVGKIIKNLTATGALIKGKYRARTNITCAHCNAEFSIENNRLGRAKYCSKNCFFAAKDRGISSENEKQRKSIKYKEWRTSVFKRDNYTCMECGVRSGLGKSVVLHADHIEPFAINKERRFDIDNGRTLCIDCHKKTDTFGVKTMRAMRYVSLILLLLCSVAHAQKLPIRIGRAGFNYATWSSTNKSSNITLSNGNLTYKGVAGNWGIGIATVGKSSGKWYWEITVDSASASGNEFAGVTNIVPVSGNTSRLGLVANSIAYRQNSGGTSYCYLVFVGGSFTTQGTGCTTDIVKNDVLSFALDMDNLTFTEYLNGNIINTAVTGLPAGTWYPACQSDGQAGQGTANFGQSSWSATTASLRATLSGLGYTIGVY